MRILQINVVLNTGSTGRIAEQLGGRILEHGHTSVIAHSRKIDSSNSSTIKIGNQLDFYQHVINTRIFDNHGFSSEKSTKKFLKKIEKINPDVIHLHNLHGYYLHVGILFDFLKTLNKPVVWTFHDCWPFTGHCAYFDRVDCEKWKTACYECPLKTYYPTSWLVDNSKNNFQKKKNHFTKLSNLTIVTPSDWLKKLIQQSFFKNNMVKVIHNGIDLSVFKPTPSNVEIKYHLNDKIVLLGVASTWDSRKGYEDFVKLSKQLSDKYQIVLVGLTRKQLAGLPSGLTGIERTENVEELAAIYSAAAIYLNPSYSDNFPTTNLEALACGTPVITYRTGGSPEAIDTDTGVVVDIGDIAQLETAIDQIIQSKDRFKSDQCRKRVEAFFNKDDRFDEYIELYKKVLS